jgi:N-acetylglucosaminyldiphosphoundecaprenol N-acetyl-beta-D-mannosaminyltransferase
MAADARLPLGALGVDPVTLREAVDAIEDLVRAGRGGAVFTPNVDHVVLVDEDQRMRDAYARASLSLVDGMPLVWASRILGAPVPEKVSGSDLVLPLLERAAERGWRVYFFGGAPGVAALARDGLRSTMPALDVVGVDAPLVDLDAAPGACAALLDPIAAARPHLVLVALGAPKQEIWIDRSREALAPAVLLGIGASLDFIAGTIPRAPRWMSRTGLEWLYRLGREPRRLWRRYLVRDPKFLVILARQLTSRAATRRRASRRAP